MYLLQWKTIKKDSFERKIFHESIDLRYSYLCIKAHKFQCYECKRYFNQRFPGRGKYQRATESLRKEAVLELALAHVNQNKVEAAYQHSDLFERRKVLMTIWGDFCGNFGEVVQLRQEKIA